MNCLKVIFHIDEVERWSRVLGNIKNLLKEVEEKDIFIEVLANGDAVKEYLKDNEKNDMTFKELSKRGVKFKACNNSLNGLDIKKADLFDFVMVVKAGVLELAEKQSKGYGYIKP